MNTLSKNVFAIFIGTILECYDYVLYAQFTDRISAEFFSFSNAYIATIITHLVFWLGFLSRIVGAILLGIISDRSGRKKSMTLAIILIAFPTAIIGLTPSYQSIGFFAPLMIVAIRILQGLSLGGEFGTACVYIFEIAQNKKQKLFYTSLLLSSFILGLLIGACVVHGVDLLIARGFSPWIWRVPFVLSALIGLIGYFARNSMVESIPLIQSKVPFLQDLKDHWKTILFMSAIYCTISLPFYSVLLSFKGIILHALSVDAEIVSIKYMYSLFLAVLGVFLGGFLSFRFHPSYVTAFFGIFALFLIIGLVVCLENWANPDLVLNLWMITSFFIGISQGSVVYLVVQKAPAACKSLCVNMSISLTATFIGATFPVLSSILYNISFGFYYMLLYMVLFYSIGIVASLKVRGLKSVATGIDE